MCHFLWLRSHGLALGSTLETAASPHVRTRLGGQPAVFSWGLWVHLGPWIFLVDQRLIVGAWSNVAFSIQIYPDISRYNIKIIKPDQLQPGSCSELQQWCPKTSTSQFIIHHAKKSDMMELWCLKYAQMLIAATELSLECQVSISILQCTTIPNVTPVTWDKRGLSSPQPSIIHFAWFDTFRHVLPWTTFERTRNSWTQC